MKRQTKIISIIACVCLIIGVVGAIIFVNEETYHDCEGQGCSICFQIHSMQQFNQLAKLIDGLSYFGVASVCYVLGFGYRKDFIRRQQTLVSRKVELLD